jgi:iron(III) transport system substrate-binding protein
MMGAYALSRSRKDLPNLRVIFPSDYTLLPARVAFVSKDARHPAAGRLWLDYLLSARGQAVLGNSVELFPIRRDVEARLSARGLLDRIGRAARPIGPAPGLTSSLRPDRRDAFVASWRKRIGSARPASCSPPQSD